MWHSEVTAEPHSPWESASRFIACWLLSWIVMIELQLLIALYTAALRVLPVPSM